MAHLHCLIFLQTSKHVHWLSVRQDMLLSGSMKALSRSVRVIDFSLFHWKGVLKLDNIIATKTEPKEWIEAMRYSPDDSLLAVTSHDNMTYIYKTSNYAL